MAQQNEELLQCRKLLLDAYSANLNNHGRLFVGFIVALLALVEVKVGFLEPGTSFSSVQSGIFYLSIFVVGLGCWFLFMRLLLYGSLVNAATHAQPLGEGITFRRMLNGLAQHVVNRRILVIFPSRLFFSAHIGGITEGQIRNWRVLGVIVCAVLSSFVTVLMRLLLG